MGAFAGFDLAHAAGNVEVQVYLSRSEKLLRKRRKKKKKKERRNKKREEERRRRGGGERGSGEKEGRVGLGGGFGICVD